jgi:hypothetical protein
MKTVLTTAEAMDTLCQSLQGRLVVDWSQVEVEPMNLAENASDVGAVRAEVKLLTRQITRENLSAKPELIEPLCRVLENVFAATACGLDIDLDRRLLGLGETFFETGYRDSAKLGSFEAVCRLFGYFESKAHSLVMASPANNLVGNSVARFIQRNLMDMDLTHAYGFFSHGAVYTHELGKFPEFGVQFLFDKNGMSRHKDLAMNQAVASLYLAAFDQDRRYIDKENYSPGSPFVKRLLSFSSMISTIAVEGSLPNWQHLDLVLAAQTLAALSRAHAASDSEADRATLESGAEALVAISVKPESAKLSLAQSPFKRYSEGTALCSDEQMAEVIKALSEAFKMAPVIESARIQAAVSRFQRQIVCELATTSIKSEYLKSREGMCFLNEFVGLAKVGLLHKDDFSQLNEKARLRLALSLSHDEVKRVLLEGYPSLRGPTFSSDLGL